MCFITMPGNCCESKNNKYHRINPKKTKGIPSFLFHIMKHSYIERVAGVKNGEYKLPYPLWPDRIWGGRMKVFDYCQEKELGNSGEINTEILPQNVKAFVVTVTEG